MNEEIFRTIVPLPKAPFCIVPAERVLCIGSCFADEMARRFQDDHFPTIANPFGVMYNPASILHTIERLRYHLDQSQLKEAGRQQDVPFTTFEKADVALLTLGTNHVYIEKATGEIVDNCQKRPQQLFEERCLGVDECADYLRRSIALLREWNPEMKIVLTVSPIRYRKYGYHESQLSKATLLMAVEKVKPTSNPSLKEGDMNTNSPEESKQAPLPWGGAGDGLLYFPSYEIMLDDLRDYRFYASDMVHPSDVAVEYIWQAFQASYLDDRSGLAVARCERIHKRLQHRPMSTNRETIERFNADTASVVRNLIKEYPYLADHPELTGFML